MPSRNIINKLIADGTIGEVTSLTANLGYELSEVKRIWDTQLAGGALLDVGVYLVNFASMVFGKDLEHVQSEAVFKNGVDMIDNINMTFAGGKQHPCSVMSMRYRTVRVRSSERRAILRSQISTIRRKSKYLMTSMKKYCAVPPPEQITGYEYEVEACCKAIEEGRLECPEMPHKETIRVMEIMDEMRKIMGSMKFRP